MIRKLNAIWWAFFHGQNKYFKKIIFRKCLNCFYFFCKYFSNNPLGFRVQIFHKNAPGLEGHVPPLKFWNLGQVNLNSFEFQNRAKMKWIPNWIFSEIFKSTFQILYFEEVMSSSLHDLNWMNLNSKAKGKSFYSHSFKSFKKFQFSLNSITQSNNHSFNY